MSKLGHFAIFDVTREYNQVCFEVFHKVDGRLVSLLRVRGFDQLLINAGASEEAVRAFLKLCQSPTRQAVVSGDTVTLPAMPTTWIRREAYVARRCKQEPS